MSVLASLRRYALGMRRRQLNSRRRRGLRHTLPARVPVVLPSELTDERVSRVAVPDATVPAYLDYVEAKGATSADAWADDDCQVGADDALQRIAEITAEQRDGAALDIAAVVRASGRPHARAAQEPDIRRHVDALLRSPADSH